jgi:hypothetical protein
MIEWNNMKENSRKEIYISVDVEADGPIPGPYSLSSLGAAVVGIGQLSTFTSIDPTEEENQFYVELKPISEDFVPEAIAVGGFDHAQLKITGQDPAEAMTAFAKWVNGQGQKYNATPVFLGYPVAYDFMFTNWYLIRFSTVSSPFGHGRTKDIKEAYAEKANTTIINSTKRQMPRHLFSTLPHTHNALDDAVEQGILFQNIKNWDGK